MVEGHVHLEPVEDRLAMDAQLAGRVKPGLGGREIERRDRRQVDLARILEILGDLRLWSRQVVGLGLAAARERHRGDHQDHSYCVLHGGRFYATALRADVA